MNTLSSTTSFLLNCKKQLFFSKYIFGIKLYMTFDMSLIK